MDYETIDYEVKEERIGILSLNRPRKYNSVNYNMMEELEVFWEELKQKVGGEEKIRYWNFIGADTYSETIERAYIASFLVTYGYATLEVHPLEEEIFIKPFQEPRSMLGKKQMVSIPVSISFEEWTKWKGGKQD